MSAEKAIVDTRQNHAAAKLPTKAAHAVRVIGKAANKANKEAMKRGLRALTAGDMSTVTEAMWELFERAEYMHDATVELLANEYADMDQTLMDYAAWERERKAGAK